MGYLELENIADRLGTDINFFIKLIIGFKLFYFLAISLAKNPFMLIKAIVGVSK